MKQEILNLRKKMKEREIDVYIVPTGDFHGSEYINDYFKTRSFLSGFTGSAGTLIVTMDDARLWVDSRYYIQGAMETEGSGITLMKMGLDGVPEVKEYLEEVSYPDMVLGFDGRIEPGKNAALLERIASENSASIVYDVDLVGEIWEDRPELKGGPLWRLPDSSSGVGYHEKLAMVREKMASAGADYYLVADLMENAYLYNLRGSDVTHTPVFFSYSLISKDSVTLYSFHPEEETKALILGDGYTSQEAEKLILKEYFDVWEDVRSISEGASILMDPATVSYALIKSVPAGAKPLLNSSPLSYMKAIKNPVEIASAKKTHIIDAVAMVRFIYWLKEKTKEAAASGDEYLSETELSSANYLESLRKEGEGYLDLSFDTIDGYGPHGAIVHYRVTPESDVHLKPQGFFLVDSGGQYLTGTTDITRTIAMGPLTDEMKRVYTAVLKAHIALALCRFTQGTTGSELDIMVREELEKYGYSYGHGTGHGVGHVLGVHEGPQSISSKGAETPLAPGMIVSNEPGYYPEGEFGVRIENLILCVEAEGPANFRVEFISEVDGHEAFGFETLTLCPYEKEAILKEELTPEEIAYIDNYHKTVFEKVSPHLEDAAVKAWLEEACKPL